MAKKKAVSIDKVIDALCSLYWTLHRHSKANSKCASLGWIYDRDSDKFDSESCISGYEFEKFMPKARKLIQQFCETKKVKP